MRRGPGAEYVNVLGRHNALHSGAELPAILIYGDLTQIFHIRLNDAP